MTDPGSNLAPSFVRINQTQWVHLSTIRIIEKVDQKYHLWVNHSGSQVVKMVVDPECTRMEEILEKLTFQTSPVSINELMTTSRVIDHRFPAESSIPLPEYPLIPQEPSVAFPEPKQSVWIGQIAAQPKRPVGGSVKNPNSFESHLGSLI